MNTLNVFKLNLASGPRRWMPSPGLVASKSWNQSRNASSPWRSKGASFLFLCWIAAIVCLLIKSTLSKLAANQVKAEIRWHQICGAIRDSVLEPLPDSFWCQLVLMTSRTVLMNWGKRQVGGWTWRLASRVVKQSCRSYWFLQMSGIQCQCLPSPVLSRFSAKAPSALPAWWEESVLQSNVTRKL